MDLGKSPALEELLAKTPNWTIRSGSMAIIFGFVMLLALTFIISYNDVIAAKTIVTSLRPPANIKARADGEISYIYVRNNDTVKQGTILMEIRNAADKKDIYNIKQKIDAFDISKYGNKDSIYSEFPPLLEMGVAQEEYNSFLESLEQYTLYSELEPDKREGEFLNLQFEEQKRILRKKENQYRKFADELELSKKNFSRNQKLFDKGVISSSEFDIVNREYLSDQQVYDNLISSVASIRLNLAEIQNRMSKSSISDINQGGNRKSELYRNIQGLKKAVSDWEYEFILKSPIDGIVNFRGITESYQNVTLGDEIITIIPIDKEGYLGKLSVPVRNSGKVKIGQEVLIKLGNYPYEQYGALKGSVKSKSGIPEEDSGTYLVYVEIKSLRTTYNKEIPFDGEMLGIAEIITEKLSLFERFIYGFRKLISRDSGY